MIGFFLFPRGIQKQASGGCRCCDGDQKYILDVMLRDSRVDLFSTVMALKAHEYESTDYHKERRIYGCLNDCVCTCYHTSILTK